MSSQAVAGICSHYLRGTCRFGNRCRTGEHPNAANSPESGPPTGFTTTAETIKTDITTEKPTWPMSSYGVAKDQPCLIEGVDLSAEELRIKFYEAKASNNPSLYPEERLTQEANQKYEYARQHLFEAFATAVKKRFQRSESNGPSTTAAATTPTGSGAFGLGTSASTSSPFNSNAGASTSAFGGGNNRSSAFAGSAGATTNSFGGQSAPAFGQTGFGSASVPKPAFGQTSAFGSAGSTPSGTSTSAFGGTNSTPPTTSAFGATGTSGQSGFGAFGTGGAGGSTPAFGQTGGGTFGQQATSHNTGGSAFGQSGFGGGTSSTAPAFGQPPALGAAGGTATSAFGQTSAMGSSSAPAFGQPSAFGAGSRPGGFGGGSSTAAAPAFGQSSTLGAGTSSAPSFGTTSFGSTPASGNTAAPAFGQSGFGAQRPAGSGGFSSSSSTSSGTTGGFGAFASNSLGGTFGGPAPRRESTPPPAYTPANPASTVATAPSTLGQQARIQPSEPPPPFSAPSATPPAGPAPGSGPTSTSGPAGASMFGRSAVPTASASAGPSRGEARNMAPIQIPLLGDRDPFARFAPKEEDLPPDVLAAFKAERFEWGKIPMMEPPISLR